MAEIEGEFWLAVAAVAMFYAWGHVAKLIDRWREGRRIAAVKKKWERIRAERAGKGSGR